MQGCLDAAPLNALQDSLQTVASLVQAVLPSDHVIARHIDRLSASNMSAKATAQKREEEQLIEVEILWSCLLL